MLACVSTDLLICLKNFDAPLTWSILVRVTPVFLSSGIIQQQDDPVVCGRYPLVRYYVFCNNVHGHKLKPPNTVDLFCGTTPVPDWLITGPTCGHLTLIMT